MLSVFLGLGVLILSLHLILEGAHWQMAPAYLGLLVFTGLVLIRRPSRTILLAGAWSVLVLTLLAACLSAILPMFRLPKPTGPYPIGTRVLYLVDPNRMETQDPSSGRKRELMIQLWYPAVTSRNPLAPYRRRAETTWLSSYQSVLWTHSRWEVPVAQGQQAFPVLLFNPSWQGRRTQNTFLVEDLASHGFVVVGIDHTYNSEPIAFPDGRVVHYAPVEQMDFDRFSWEQINAAAEKELDRQTADDIFVLDQLQAMNEDPASPLYQRLDADKTGALGHSIGGAVAAQAALLDPRIRSALDLDGSLFGEVAREGLRKPFMFISEDPHDYPLPQTLSPSDKINVALDERDAAMVKKSETYRIFLRGSTHLSFTDKVLFSPIHSASGRGKLPPRRECFILRAYALAFFDSTLKGNNKQLLDLEKGPFPEASLQPGYPSL
jgi:dienelactone hydrolase